MGLDRTLGLWCQAGNAGFSGRLNHEKLAIRAGIGLALLVLMVVGASYALPRIVTVERAVVVGRSPPILYTMLASNRTYRLWAWWPEKSPPEVSYEAADYGAGARLVWRSGKAGAIAPSWR
ncbi:hypothetical protein E6W36_15530 [Hankyongella ginsenosidimutans]|uniref:Uncharacterized protein n=1 Tax=Hankyongella ginsenosidimutans TaxID=1763828 RepID=A0A4D7CAG7_9SPHN|nr:hypothetical protein [Hankyongella ginsenosidimutans]QCI80417.1 hypothetical protein E6W36_15530 [Hankyongella ginsenosidimutans]